MTISVEANGLTFSFPDGTTTAQIGEAIDGYFAGNKPPEQETAWTDLKHGAGKMVDSLIHEAVSINPAVSEAMGWSEKLGVHPQGVIAEDIRGGNAVAALTPEPKTTTGKLISMVPALAASIPGWEFGVDALAESAIPGISERMLASSPGWVKWTADKALKGVAGTLGGDVTSAESPTNALKGGMGNVVGEALFHTPQALRFMKVLLAKNGDAIQQAAAHIGVNPSMGVTTSRAWLRTLENLINKVPGGHLLNIQNAKSLAAMDSFIQGIKSKLGYNGDASALGREIRQAVEAAERDFKAESEKLYDDIFNKIGKYQKTNTRRWVRKVEELYGVVERPGMTEMTAPPVVRKYMKWIDQAGKKPTNSGYSNLPMSFSDARKILKNLDDYIGTGENADADTAAAKQMASALRADIAGAFETLGHGEQWRSIQDHYAEGVAMLEQARAVMGRADTGDAIYTRLFGSESGVFSPKGVDTLNALKNVMNPEEWRHVAAEVVHKMGLESAGNAAAEGRAFNPSVFLTNWNRVSPQAREVIFEPGHLYDLEQLAKLSEGFKNLGRDANHSNTAHHMAAMGMMGMAVNPLMWPKLAATVGSSALLAKLLINPDATRLLVEASHATEPTQMQRVIIRLIALSAANPELSDAIASLGDDQN